MNSASTPRSLLRATLLHLGLLPLARRVAGYLRNRRFAAAARRAASLPASAPLPQTLPQTAPLSQPPPAPQTAKHQPTPPSADYLIKVAQEQANYAEVTNVHELPEIFHYWSHKYLRPKAEAMGFSHPDEFFANYLEKSLATGRQSRFVSVGSGNCDTEVRVANLLKQRGHTNFLIECLDINPDMLGRGAAMAKEHGVEGMVKPIEGDFNRWKPTQQYDAVLANQSLHHVVELEHLFDSIKEAIGEHGRFITSDMIGRNGHQRWPEALEIVQSFWDELPRSYRYNKLLSRQEDRFMDWDCSVSGFEGVRAQDILPLTHERFGFELFLPFANVIDPFVDRAFGHHFNAAADWDRAFIDRVHERDEQELLAGRIKPAHMFAVMRNGKVAETKQLEGLSPAHCLRPV